MAVVTKTASSVDDCKICVIFDIGFDFNPLTIMFLQNFN